MARYLLNPIDAAESLIKENGNWMVATIKTRISWPIRKQVIAYEDMDFILFPQSDTESAGIALRADKYGLKSDEARRQIMCFCSALCWTERAAVEIIAWGGGNLPRPIHIRSGQTIVDYLQAEHLPKVTTDEEKAALAFYREGISINNPFYAFLSLFKAISVFFSNGKQRENWIAAILGDLDDDNAKKRYAQLASEVSDVGKYIWDEGRNAITHSERDTYVNPDEIDDHFRLRQDMPLMKNLAELTIEKQSAIKRTRTIWKEHLYELDGFRKLIPDEILGLIECSEEVPAGLTIDMPEYITVLARRGSTSHPFQDVQIKALAQVKGGLLIDIATKDEIVGFRVILDFLDERLHFDPVNGMRLESNRENKKHIEYEILFLEFQCCILGNGRLEIWDQEEEVILGQSAECIPKNCYVNHEHFTKELEKLKKLLTEQ